MTNWAKRQPDGKAASASASAPPPGVDTDAPAAGMDLLLTAGGDERIWPDPVTRRNRYGTPALPQPDEIWFSSSTASAITAPGCAAARRAFARLTGRASGVPRDPEAWFDDLRARIVAAFGIAGSEVILSASGTEAELTALAVAKTALRTPLTSIVIAPDETGSGVLHAAAGTHFAATAAFAASVEKGSWLAGWENDATATVRIEIREQTGRLRDPATVDLATRASVDAALLAGRNVLLHLLDTSKTGRGGPSRATAKEIAGAAGGRVLVVVDACQLRCSFDQIRADLAAGFLVMVTGSKFAGGPPFCGALLMPPCLLDRLRDLRFPSGLAAYSARLDWPSRLRAAVDGEAFAIANLGMGLRWEAALCEIEAYAVILPRLREEIAAAFAETVRRCVAARPDLSFLDENLARPAAAAPTIFPIVTGDGDVAQARRIYEGLRTPGGGAGSGESAILARVCHVGQPVVIAKRAALRMCSSMPMTSAVAARLADGADFRAAFLTVKQDIELVFAKWELLAGEIAATGSVSSRT
jgi:hypothetical protein